MSGLDWMTALSASGGGGIIGVIGTRVFDWGKTKSDIRINSRQEIKIDADAAKVIADTAVALVAPLKAEIEGLKVRVDAYQDYIGKLHVWISERISEVPPKPPMLLDLRGGER